jgi:hypothetical protein
MQTFNYTDFHLFNKEGVELPLVFDATYKIVVPNQIDDDVEFYMISDPAGNIKYHKISKDTKFYIGNSTVNTIDGISSVSVVGNLVSNNKVIDSFNLKLSISDINDNLNSSYKSVDDIIEIEGVETILDLIKFPSISFSTGISFNRISTGLIETQSIYILINENNSFIKIFDSIDESVINWKNRYKLLFFIDTRNDNDFRFFNITDSDEIEWTNKIILDFLSEDSYRINIGFVSDEEGVHEKTLAVCLLDTQDTTDDGYEKIYPIGTIYLQAEAVGEDERYRTLFTNFGIPDPITYSNIFNNTDLNESNTDNVLLNQNSKKLFLSYTDIFPYVGTYKALINAINVLGYQDEIYFKEWYKNINVTTDQGKYTTYDVNFGEYSNTLNTINNLTIDERIQLKKLNWLSMIYKINEQLKSVGTDEYDFPFINQLYDYNDSDLLVKLVSLKSWLEKYILGVNCRIIDIGGEGIYFERYKLDSYGSYQTILEWNNEKNIAPLVINDTSNNILIDSSAYIEVDLGVNDTNTSLEDIVKYKIIDFCEGYFDNNDVYHNISLYADDSNVKSYFGGTFEYLRGTDTYELKASTSVNGFLFNENFIKFNDVNDDSTNRPVGAKLKVSNNEIFFNPLDLYNRHHKCSPFTNLPIIQIEKANLRSKGQWETSIVYSIYPDLKDDTTESYIIENIKTHEKQSTIDYVTFIPPTHNEDIDTITITPYNCNEFQISKIIDASVVSDFAEPEYKFNKLNYMYGLTYSALNSYNVPLFSILGYQIDHITNNIPSNEEFYLEILDGKMLFLDKDNDREIYLNFSFDNSTNLQSINVNIVYHSDEFTISKFKISSNKTVKYFLEGNTYTDFLKEYANNPESVIQNTFNHKIKVNNSGKFLVDVFEKDSKNNIFAAACDNYGNIIMPHFDLLEYSNTLNINDTEKITVLDELKAEAIKDNFIDFCIYSPTTLSSGISINKTVDSYSITHPSYSNGIHNVQPNEYIHAIDITDKYRIDAIDNIKSTLLATTDNKSLYESYNLILSPATSKRYNKILDFNDIYGAASLNNNIIPKYSSNINKNENEIISGTATDYLKHFSKSDENFADVNIVFYNELNAHPVYQTYGVLASDQVISGSKYNNKYRLLVNDYSGESYIWGDMHQCTEGFLKMALMDKFDEILGTTYEKAEMLLIDYMFKTLKDASLSNVITYNKISDLNTNDALKDFILDCSTYKEYDNNIIERDSLIEFHMLGEASSNITNILYDLEAFITETDTDIKTELPESLYVYLYNDEYNYFEIWINEIMSQNSSLNEYLNDLSYKECIDYFKISTNVACKVSQKCIVDSQINNNIISSICDEYATLFATDNETKIIYTLTDENNVSIIKSIMSNVVFEDLSIISDSSIANMFSNAILPFAKMIDNPDEEVSLKYYIASLYGMMIFVTTMCLKKVITIAKTATNNYCGLYSDESKRVYNRFCIAFDDSDNSSDTVDGSLDNIDPNKINRLEKINKSAIALLSGFSSIMYKMYISTIEDENDQSTEQSNITISNEFTCNIFKSLANNIFDASCNIEIGSIYHKLINNIAYENYKIMRNQNWVFKNELKYLNDIYPKNIDDTHCKFAILVNNENYASNNKLYYAKTAEYGDDGYSELTYDVPITSTVSIKDLAERPYISLYVKPIWIARVDAYILSNKTASEMGLDPLYDYICIGYKKSLFTNQFKIGEKVKLIFQTIEQNEFFGQSTYEVVSYDLTKNYIILKGTINSAYINNNEEELWGYLPVKNGYAYIPGADSIQTLDEFNNVINVNNTKTDVNTSIAITPTTKYIVVTYSMRNNNISLTVPVKYVSIDSEESTGYWLYQLYAKEDNSSAYAISIKASKIEKMNIYVSYAHHGFVDYPMKSIKFSENYDGTTKIDIEKTEKNKKILDFVDDTFSILSKGFDIDSGVYHWMSGKKLDNTLNGGIPTIMDSSIYEYKNNFLETPIHSDIVISSYDASSYIDNNTSYKYWKVYHNEGDGTSKLLFESYNPLLYLTPREKGIYDVEATIYDNYGNESTHLYKGAYIII